MTYVKVVYIYLNKKMFWFLLFEKGRIVVLRFHEEASLLLCPSLMTCTLSSKLWRLM